MGIFLLLFLATKILPSETAATLEIMLVSFENDAGEDYYGSWCDRTAFGGQCDHQFDIYLYDEKSRLIKTLISSSFNDKDTIIFPQNQMIRNIYNPIVQKYTTWTGSVLFEVKVFDSDSFGYERVDTISEYIYAKPALSKDDSVSKTFSYWGNRWRSSTKTKLDINVHLYCNTNFYGVNCAIECLPVDNIYGHYTCDPTTGAIICQPGWEDISENCTTIAKNCLNNKCQNKAICVEANRNYTCTCMPGFTGRYCETNINECLSSPCKNGGRCKDFINDFFCNCPKNFAGKTCRITACMLNNPCLNGGVCHGHSSCLCQSSYYGEKCENAKIIPINESLTIHSTNQSFTNGKLILAFFIFTFIFLGIIVFSISLRLYRRRCRSRTIGATECEISIITASAPCSTLTPPPNFNFDMEPNKGDNEHKINFPIMTSPEENEYTIID